MEISERTRHLVTYLALPEHEVEESCKIEMLKSSAGFLNSVKARLIVEPHFVDGFMSTDRCCALLKAARDKVRLRGKVGESEALIEAVP